MQLTLQPTRRTPHGASRLVQAMSAWLVKIRRAPSGIVGMRGFNSYGHTTTVMHEMSTPSPPPTQTLAPTCCALQLNPDFPSALFNFGVSQLLAGDHFRSVLAMERALELEPKNFKIVVYLGQASSSELHK